MKKIFFVSLFMQAAFIYVAAQKINDHELLYTSWYCSNVTLSDTLLLDKDTIELAVIPDTVTSVAGRWEFSFCPEEACPDNYISIFYADLSSLAKRTGNKPARIEITYMYPGQRLDWLLDARKRRLSVYGEHFQREFSVSRFRDGIRLVKIR